MRSRTNGDLSVSMTSFFMKCVGFWPAADQKEQMYRNGALYYTIGAVSFAVWVETLDFYHSLGNFSDVAYLTCNIMTLLIVLYKIVILSVYQDDFFNLLRYTQRNFWHSYYDKRCTEIMTLCKKRSTLFVTSFTFFSQSTICCYAIIPLIENTGRNESDRLLPFTMWIDLPLSETPYYEITYVIQVLSLYHVGICFFCFDNFLCILNVHTAGQFRMLKYQLLMVCGIKDSNDSVDGDNSFKTCLSKSSKESYKNLKNCIQQHQELIDYSRKLDKIFTYIILGQVLLFSLLLCFVGYQVLLANGPPTRRVLFMIYISGTFTQLLLVTSSCHGIIEESGKIAQAAYSSYWHSLPNDKAGNNLRKSLMIIIMRAHKPCCLTAGGFFPVSLETTTTVLSTAMSYFTLLKNRSTDISN